MTGAAPGPHAYLPFNPRVVKELDGKTLLFPVWDPLVNPLLAAGLRREGVDARVLEEDPCVIRTAMRHNTGQCIPLNVIVRGGRPIRGEAWPGPGRTAVWMARSLLSCNIGMFPFYIKSLLEARGGGMEKVEVYTGSAFYLDFSLRATLTAYRAYLAGGLLRRLGCRLRPYEKERGAVDRATASSLEMLIPAFEGKTSREAALRDVAAVFGGIETMPVPRPKVAIFGDLYVRDNDVMNQELISCLEEAGGEVVTTPYTDYMRIVARAYFRKWFEAGEYAASFGYRALWTLADSLGRKDAELFEPILGQQPPVHGRGCRADRGGVRHQERARRRILRQPPQGEPPCQGVSRPAAVRAGEPRVLLSLSRHGGHGAGYRADHGRAGGEHHLRRHGAVPQRRRGSLHRSTR